MTESGNLLTHALELSAFCKWIVATSQLLNKKLVPNVETVSPPGEVGYYPLAEVSKLPDSVTTPGWMDR